jgi:hypothetical protein
MALVRVDTSALETAIVDIHDAIGKLREELADAVEKLRGQIRDVSNDVDDLNNRLYDLERKP